MNLHLRPVEAPEVIPERLEPIPARTALFQAILDFEEIATDANHHSNLPHYLASKMARIRACALNGKHTLEAIRRAHDIAEGRALTNGDAS